MCFRHQVLILGSAGCSHARLLLFSVARDPLHMVVLLVLVVIHYTGLVQKTLGRLAETLGDLGGLFVVYRYLMPVLGNR